MIPLPPRNLQAMEGGRASRSSRLVLGVSVLATALVSFSAGYLLGKYSPGAPGERSDAGAGSEEAPQVEIIRPAQPSLAAPPPATASGEASTSPAALPSSAPVPLPAAPLKAEAPEEKPRPIQPPAKKELRYTIQIASFQDRESAERLALELESRGLDAYVEKTTIPRRGVWYRVRVGSFATKEEARSWAEKNLERLGRKGYFPTPRTLP